MGHLGRIGLAVALLIFLGIAGGPALAADVAPTSDAPAPSRSPSDLHLSVSEIGVPWSASLLPGLQRTTDGLDDVRLGAGMTLPLSSRAELYGEYRFLRGRVDAGTGRGLLQREPDSSDFRAGFSIRLN